MESYDPSDIESILLFSRRLEGRRLDEVLDDIDPVTISGVQTKGRVGHLYEQFFGIPRNSLAAPDFTLAGVELKIVPLVGAPSQRRVKERTFITQINYGDMPETPYRRSHLRAKSERILLIFYEWLRDRPIAKFKTLRVHLWERDDFDEMLLAFAYMHVRTRVLAGEAHLISEADTEGIGAATKGAGGAWVKQPFSSTPAKPRALAFKPPFMRAVWESLNDRLEPIPEIDAVTPSEFEARMIARAKAYLGMTVAQIARRLGTQLGAGKSALAMLTRRMLGAPEGKRDIEELAKLGVKMVTVRIEEKGNPSEDVSFPAMDFLEVAKETSWETSTLREQARHLFFTVFRHRTHDDLEDATFLGAFFWRPSAEEEEVMAAEWRRFRRHIREGTMDARPPASATEIIHIRPHGKDAKDVMPLPTGGTYVRSSFWLNKSFVRILLTSNLAHGTSGLP